MGQKFQKLDEGLDASRQIHLEEEEAKAKDGTLHHAAVSPVVQRIMKVDILFGQGVYSRSDMGVGVTRRASTVCGDRSGGGGGAEHRHFSEGADGPFDPYSVAGCFNCEHPGHTMRDYSQPLIATRPALTPALTQLTLTTKDAFDADAQARRNPYLSYPKLDETPLRLDFNADASFQRNRDSSSLIGSNRVLCAGNGMAHVHSHRRNKIRWLVRSTMTRQVCAFRQYSCATTSSIKTRATFRSSSSLSPTMCST